MALTTVVVNGNIHLPDGAVPDSATLEFRLVGNGFDMTSNEVIPQSFIADDLNVSTGAFTANLWPNDRGSLATYYQCILTFTGSSRGKKSSIQLGDFQVPEAGAPHEFATLRTNGVISANSVIVSQLTQNQYNTVVDTVVNAEAVEAAVVQAEVAATNAEVARDAAFVNADVYADIASGLAATSDGEQFSVVDASGDYIQRYLNNAGVADEIAGATYPTVNYVDRTTEIDREVAYPEGLIAETVRLSTDTSIYIDDLGRYNHGGSGTTSFDGWLRLTPDMRAELGAGRNLRIVVKLVSGSFGSDPRVDDTVDVNAVADGSVYTITVDSATYDETTVQLRTRWTAAQGSIIVGPMVLKESQVLVPTNSVIWQEVSRAHAETVATSNGNHCWGFYAPPDGSSGIEDLSGASDLIGVSGFSNAGRTIRAAGRARVTAYGKCRGLVEGGTYVTAVYELTSPSNSVREHGLGFSSGFSGSAATSDSIKATMRMGNLIVQQHRVDLDDNYSDGRPVDMIFSMDNRAGDIVSDADLGEASLHLRVLMCHDEIIDPAHVLAVSHLERCLEDRLNSACIVDGSLAESAPLDHQYKTFIEALRRGYGHIGLRNDDEAVPSEYNTPGGFTMSYPARIYTAGDGRAILGSWEDHTAASFTDNGDGTWSKTLDHADQSGVSSGLVVERKASDGSFTYFWTRGSAAEVVSEATDLVHHYDTSTKVLTINDNTAGAVYRTNRSNQSNFLNARCRRGRASGDRRSVLERVDLRYSNNNLIDLSNGGVLEHRSTRIGRAAGNGQQVESGGWWIDLGYDTVGEYVGNDVWGANSYHRDPCRWTIHSPGARYTQGGDGFATHGNYIYVDATGEPWADEIAKMGWVTINDGEYRINAFRCGETGIDGFGGGSMLFLAPATDMLIEIGQVRGDKLTFDSGAHGWVGEFIELPKQGSGVGGVGVETTNVVVEKHVELVDAGSGSYTSTVSYNY